MTNAKEFFQAAKQLCKKINVLYVLQPVIEGERERLQERWDRCKGIPQTHSIHFAAKASNSTITVAKNSQFFQKDVCQEYVLIKSVEGTTETPSSAPKLSDKRQSAASGPNPPQGASAGSRVHVEYGLPQALAQILSGSDSFLFPCYKEPFVKLLVSDISNFSGSGIIDENDLRHLFGNGKTDEDNFLSNFVLDQYFLLQKESEVHGSKTAVLAWEKFERGSVSMLSQELQKQGEVKENDTILVPCNRIGTKHWFLLVVKPKEKCMAVLDSLAGDFVKPTAITVINKMYQILQQLDQNFDKRQWKFVANNRKDIPLQENGYDCGVFVALFSRCLIVKGMSMIKPQDIPDFRKHMIIELHEKKLSPIPPEPIRVDEYYAVDYISIYYFGRVLEPCSSDGFVKFKFLHSAGANKHDWPRTDDIERVHVSCIFYGPVHVEGNRPFIIIEHEAVQKVFLARKRLL